MTLDNGHDPQPGEIGRMTGLQTLAGGAAGTGAAASGAAGCGPVFAPSGSGNPRPIASVVSCGLHFWPAALSALWASCFSSSVWLLAEISRRSTFPRPRPL